MGRVVLLVLASLFLLASAACGGGGEAGQEGSPPPGGDNGEEASPKTVASASPEETTSSGGARGEIPVSGIVGEVVETDSFEYRVLDQFVTDRYFYNENPYIETVVDGYSQAGQFLVVTYSVTNTSPQAVDPTLAASVEVKTEDGATEVYQESDQISHPRGKGGMVNLDLAPRQMGTSQFIFDIPVDVEPQQITVRVEEATGAPASGAGVVDVTRQDPRGPRPEEVLALQYEYGNMELYEQAYDLFAQESKDRVTLEQYQGYQEGSNAESGASAVEGYAFPSVEVQGNRATIERVLTISDAQTPEGQEKATQEMILEDKGWRILMREDQVEAFTGGGAAPAAGETTQYGP